MSSSLAKDGFLISEDARMIRTQVMRTHWTGDKIKKLYANIYPYLQHSYELIRSRDFHPNLRVKEYLECQNHAQVYEIVKKFASRWTHVNFDDFMVVLRNMIPKFLSAIDSDNTVFIFVDNFVKSSFWVLMLAMDAIEKNPVWREKWHEALDRIHVMIDYLPEQMDIEWSKRKTYKLVFFDDATYSGSQLSYFVRVVESFFKHQKLKHKTFAFVPYVSSYSKRWLSKTTVLQGSVLFKHAFYRMSLASILKDDFFFEVDSPIVFDKAYKSFISNFLQMDMAHSTITFQHKVADEVSIPVVLLHVGQVFPPFVHHVYRIPSKKVDKVIDLLLASSLGNVCKRACTKNVSYRSICKRVCNAMMSKKFREDFMERIKLLPNPHRPADAPQVAFSPILPPESCDSTSYSRMIKRLVSRGESFAVLQKNFTYEIPECIVPPYKTSLGKLKKNNTSLSSIEEHKLLSKIKTKQDLPL